MFKSIKEKMATKPAIQQHLNVKPAANGGIQGFGGLRKMTRLPKHENHFFQGSGDEVGLYSSVMIGTISIIVVFCIIMAVIGVEDSERQKLIIQYNALKQYDFLDQVPLKEWLEADHQGRLYLIKITTEAN